MDLEVIGTIRKFKDKSELLQYVGGEPDNEQVEKGNSPHH